MNHNLDWFTDRIGQEVEKKTNAGAVEKVKIVNTTMAETFYNMQEQHHGHILFFDIGEEEKPVTEKPKEVKKSSSTPFAKGIKKK